MRSLHIDFGLLSRQGRWKVDFFLPAEGEQHGLAAEGSRRLVPWRLLVRERQGRVNPAAPGNAGVNYPGREPVRPFTGELAGFRPRPATDTRSPPEVFRPGDVLYGRLRPNLNKVWLARGNPCEGICPTEFPVLTPVTDRVRPVVLRYRLSSGDVQSHYVQSHVGRLQTGTARPRISLDDLLDIKVPVPDLETRGRLERGKTGEQVAG